MLGGARSGKSAHAEALVTGAVTYVATGRRDPSDTDWQARIAAHVCADRRNAPLLAYLIGRSRGDRPLAEILDAVHKASSSS